MDEHLERYEPTQEDQTLFNELIAFVRANQELFKEAGQWLDSGFGRGSEPWKKAIRESKRALKSKRPPDGSLTKGYYSYYRFESALLEVLPEVQRLSVLQRKERSRVASRYLLLVWMLIDPDAKDLQPHLTEFQTWGWNPADADTTTDDHFQGIYIPDDRDDSRFSRTYARKQLVDKDTASRVRDAISVLDFTENGGDPSGRSPPGSGDNDKVLKTAQIAKRAGCSNDTVLNAIKYGHLDAIAPAQDGGRASYSAWQSVVDRWIEAGKPAGIRSTKIRSPE